MQEIKATVFGYDPTTDMVMLREAGTHGGVVNVRLYKAAQLTVCRCAAAAFGAVCCVTAGRMAVALAAGRQARGVDPPDRRTLCNGAAGARRLLQ
jgi:hypothetical protein